MKFAHGFVLSAAIGFGGVAAASSVTPSVTGTVTRVIPSGSVKQITVNGHVYIVSAGTKTDSATNQLQPGQTVTVLLAPDGQNVIMVHSANSTAAHQ
jgi:hypothetical protein